MESSTFTSYNYSSASFARLSTTISARAFNARVPGVTIQFGTLSDYFQKLQGSFDVPCSREVSLPTRIGNGVTGVASLRCESLIKH
jgi:hypothetical protein